MIPWVKDQITEVWDNRKGSRSTKKESLNGSSKNFKGMQTSAPSTGFLINVISLEGDVLNIAVTLEFTIEKVKSIAIEHFYGHDRSKIGSQFRLVHGILLKSLADKKNLGEEEISESDELLIVKSRFPPEKLNLANETFKGPTDDDIKKATKNLIIKNPSKPMVNPDCPEDFQNEIRKIFITLVQTSAKILMYSPEANKFCNIINKKLEHQLKPASDPKAIKYLVEMGFSESKALRALQLRRMNTIEALEWLFEHQDDSDDDEDLQLPSLEIILSAETGPSSSNILKGAKKNSFKEIIFKLFKKHNDLEKKGSNLIQIVNLLLNSFRHYQKMDFKPNLNLIQSLEEMGFEKPKILETLKITGNNLANACAWLLGERTPSLQNLYEGMDPDEPIYNAIMNNPQIQLSLTDPKMLIAYLSMIETSKSTSMWMKDPQVSPILSQIFKTYHAEKHVILLNRYNNS